MQKQIIFLHLYLVNAVNKVKTINNYCLYLSYQTLKMSLSKFVLIFQIDYRVTRLLTFLPDWTEIWHFDSKIQWKVTISIFFGM
jgi:hypothetical protein